MSFSLANFVQTFKHTKTLNEYFEKNNIGILLTKEDSKVARKDNFLEQFSKLESKLQYKVQSDFRKVSECSDKRIFEQLVIEIKEDKNKTPISQEFLDSSPSLKEKFLYLYLDHRKLFIKLELEKTLIKSQGWLSFHLNTLSSNQRSIDTKAIEGKLSENLSKNIFVTQQRGKRCTIEHVVVEDGSFAFIAYPEDYATSLTEYDKSNTLNKDKIRNPIFKVYFLYDPELNILRVKAQGGKSQVKKYAELFVQTVFDDEEWEAEKHLSKAYLEQILEPNFYFKVENRFEGIYLKAITLDFEDSRILYFLKGRTGNDKKLFMEKLKLKSNPNIFQKPIKIKNIKLLAKLKDKGLKKGKSIIFDITDEGNTTLHNEVKAKEILKMLINSGIIHG